MSNVVIDPLTGSQMEYGDLIKDTKLQETWTTSMANELVRLSQGLGEQIPTGSDTVHFISKDGVSEGNFAMYVRILCKIRPQKVEIRCTRLTVGGNLIKYPHNVITTMTDISAAKFLINSVISTLNEYLCGADIKNIYLFTPMDTFEYMGIKLLLVHKEIIQQYQLADKIHNCFIYMEIRKDIYGFPQAGIIVHAQLKEHLAPFGCKPFQYTTGPWEHENRVTKLYLVVNNCDIK